MGLIQNQSLDGNALVDPLTSLPSSSSGLLHPIAQVFDPVPLQVVRITNSILLGCGHISSSDLVPTILTIKQYPSNYIDEDFILVDLGTPWGLWECLTAGCKAFSLANGKGTGTNDWVIRSLDD